MILDNIIEKVIENIAKICHQANKAYCESLDDYSQVDWENCNESQRKSAILGVKFRVENPHSSPADQHQSWSDQKISDGWVFGVIKSEQDKTHPCLIPYDELPVEQKTKDKLFQGIVDSVLFYTDFNKQNHAPENDIEVKM